MSLDGKIIKNITRNQGVERFLPTYFKQKIRYYTKQELEKSDIPQKVEILLQKLDKESKPYEEYLINYRKKYLHK